MNQNLLQLIRLGIGFGQGIFLFALQQSLVARSGLAINEYVFAALLAAGFFVPLIVIAGLGNLRPRTLIVWTVVASVICCLLASYDIWRADSASLIRIRANTAIPSIWLWLGLAVILFIIDRLVVAADTDRRWIGRYSTLFNVSWKLGLQIHLATLFVAILAGILVLGATLFGLIGISAIWRLIAQPLFWIPVGAVGIAYALHVTDTRAAIIRGTRALILTLLSWLLPVMTVLAAGFILSLPFTGLDALWSTRRATLILMTTAGALVFLINAAYQDGEEGNAGLLPYFRIAASACLLPLVLLAGYALSLRVSQYGWTPDRVITAALMLIAACYAVGYCAAALLTRVPLRGIEPVNVGTALVAVAVLIALLSPLADPLRLSVGSQLARLADGRVTADKFDYAFLRRSGRYGKAALNEIESQAYGPVAAANARDSRSMPQPRNNFQIASPEEILANILVVYPKEGTLPATLLQKDWSREPRRFSLPGCMTAKAQCNAVIADLDGDGKDEAILFVKPAGSGALFKEHEDGWKFEGHLNNGYCNGVRDALARGEVTFVEPRFKDIQVAGQRLSLTQTCAPSVNAIKR